MDPILKTGKLIWPAMVGILCAAIAALPEQWMVLLPIGPVLKALSKWPTLSWVELVYSDGQTNLTHVRIILATSAFALIVYLGIRDYSRFFPQRFNIKVYFDDDGIVKALQEFDTSEISKLNLVNDWKSSKIKYFENLNARLSEASFSFRFRHVDGSTSGSGHGTLKARLLDRWGVQKYKIMDGHGQLTFVNIAPRSGTTQLFTGYKLLDSRANDLKVALSDIYTMKPIILMPEFKQVIHRTAEAEEFDHILCTATKIRFLPIIDLGTTIYMFKQDDGLRVPIGYAIYEPEW